MRLLWVSTEGVSPDETERRALENLGKFSIETVSGPVAALEDLKNSTYDCILADFPFGEWTPEEWLEEVQRVRSFIPVLVRDRAGSFDDAVRLTKLGAYHFFGAGATVADLARILEEAIEYKRTRELALFGAALADEPWKRFLVGESRPMQDIAHIVRLVGPRRSTVLITGETGTGKEMVARAIHIASSRAHLPMVAVNCSALPEALLEAELFGHVKGAFTGAVNHRVGRFEQAHRSTLFLDEIGDMALDLQSKLLRVLQEREMQRVGSSETVHLDVRVIAASNADLPERIRQGKFREDLFYRLNVVPVRMPRCGSGWKTSLCSYTTSWTRSAARRTSLAKGSRARPWTGFAPIAGRAMCGSWKTRSRCRSPSAATSGNCTRAILRSPRSGCASRSPWRRRPPSGCPRAGSISSAR